MTNLPATVPNVPVVGLEDYDPETDVVMPRIQIIGKDRVYKDSLSGETWPGMDVIILGVVKGRVLFDAIVREDEEGRKPWCKSVNFTEGIPNPLGGEKFPWELSGFAQADYPEGSRLPCESCKLQTWGTHPITEAPFCAEQHNYVLMLLGESGEHAGLATLTVQRSGIQNSRTYMSSFARPPSEPMFICQTHLGLQGLSRGSVDYAKPLFARGALTDPNYHDQYAEAYLRIRKLLQSERFASPEDDVEVVAGGAQPVPVQVPAPAAPQPAPAAPPVAPQSAPAAAPVDPAPAPQPTQQPAPAAPAPAPQPAQPQPQPAQPAQAPSPAPVVAATTVTDDDLPF